MTLADQSAEYDDLLDALATVCQFGSGLHSSKVVEWFGETRPQVEGQQCITIWLKEWIPDEYSGAGREGMLTFLVVEIALWTRMALDKGSTDKWRFRGTSPGHLRRMMGLFNYIDGHHLYTGYNAVTKKATGDPLCWEPLQHMPGPVAQRVDVEDETWIKTPLRFRTRIAKPEDVDINYG